MIKKYKFATLLIFTLMMAPILINTAGYSEKYGIEIDDTVTIKYVGTLENGEVFDQREKATFVVNEKNLIPGFVDGLLGMKYGERKKFSIPPSRGYKTGDLAGKTLLFDVTILGIKGYDPDKPLSISTAFSSALITLGIIVISSLGVIVVYGILKNRLIPSMTKCIICGSAYAGTCANCNRPYCREDFGRRCRECNYKIFTPRKS